MRSNHPMRLLTRRKKMMMTKLRGLTKTLPPGAMTEMADSKMMTRRERRIMTMTNESHLCRRGSMMMPTRMMTRMRRRKEILWKVAEVG